MFARLAHVPRIVTLVARLQRHRGRAISSPEQTSRWHGTRDASTTPRLIGSLRSIQRMNELFGLPAHPLLVHAAVVLVPLAAVGIVLIAVVPGWRARFGIVVFALAVAATVFAFVAKESGEALEDSVRESDVLEQHAALGDAAVWFALPLVVVAGVLWWLGRRGTRSTSDASRTDSSTSTSTSSGPKPLAPWLNVVVAVVAIAVAAGSTVQFIQIGHLGAQATWSNVQVTNGGGEDGDGDGD